MPYLLWALEMSMAGALNRGGIPPQRGILVFQGGNINLPTNFKSFKKLVNNNSAFSLVKYYLSLSVN